MADIGHERTDKLIKETEKKVAREYARAQKEVQRKLERYFARVQAEAEEKRQQYEAGEISLKDYKDWILRKTAMGKRWEDLRDNLAEDYHNANQIAKSIVKGYQAEAYALNHNYATYQIEHDGGIDSFYTLYDKQTVERLIRDDQILMPPPGQKMKAQIAANKDMQWNMQQLQSALTQAVLQGESIPEFAKRISNTVAVRNYNSSVRYARTMMTSAENAGRYDGYRRATKMGIDLTIEWSATLDGRTRHDHRMMHGQRRDVDEPFETPDGFRIMYPADCTGESDVPQQEIWNCRCTLLAWVKGFEGDTVKSSPKMGEMTFDEWQHEHEPKKPEEPKAETLFHNEKMKAALGDTDYKAFRDKVNGSEAKPFFEQYADEAKRVTISRNGGEFRHGPMSIDASYEIKEGMDRYSVVAHEYNHMFDYCAGRMDGLNFKEVDLINERCKEGLLINWNPLTAQPSSSDEFLTALRKDMEGLKKSVADGSLKKAWGWAGEAVDRNSSSGIQDALDGFFGTQDKGILPWGHGDKYYNRAYNRRFKGMGIEKQLKAAMQELGFDASNQAKVKRHARQYEAASEAWANVGSAVTCGGPELKMMEKYMPETVKAYRMIAKMAGGR